MIDPAVDFKELETRGFLVLRSFAGEEDLEILRRAYDPDRRTPLHRHVTLVAPAAAVEPLRRKLEALLPELRRATDLSIDTVLQGGGLYLSTKHGMIGWHTDNLVFYILQNTYHHLNFWMPIVKPDAERSGLSLVPMDRLASEAPEIYEATVGRGAARLAGGELVYEADDGLRSIPCPDLSRLADTPSLGPGDLVVTRGDVLHKTQDTLTSRIAVSIRAVASQRVITRDTFLRGSSDKHKRMREDVHIFAPLLASFGLRRAISIGDYYRFLERLARYDASAVIASAVARSLFPAVLAAAARSA